MEFTDRTEHVSVVDIIKQNGFHHSECYQTFSNLNEVKRAEKCLSSLNNDKQSAQTMLDRKVGRPSFKQGNQLEYKKLKKKNFMAPFYGWGSTASRLQPLQGGSLLFTIQFPENPGTHFTNLRRMKG